MKNDLENILSSAIDVSKKRMSQEIELLEDTKKNGWEGIEGFSKKRRYKTFDKKTEVSAWTNLNLVEYFVTLFNEKTGTILALATPSAVSNMKKMRDEFTKLVGRPPSNDEVKAYLDWFADTKLLNLIARYNSFKTSFWSFSPNVKTFIDKHLNLDQVQKEVGLDSNIKDANLFTSKVMASVYAANKEQFVTKYGLVLSAVWMMRKENKTEKQAVEEVLALAVKIAEEGKSELLIKATARHNPYPIWCKFQSLDHILAELTSRTGEFFDSLSIVFMEESQNFTFLS